MATFISEPTTIFSLSTELQQAIIEKTDRTGIKSIRLTCRELSAAADYVFIEEFFSTRKHLLTAHSLQVLVEIAKIPRFGSKIRSIRFSHMSPLRFTVLPPAIKDVVKEKWHSIMPVTSKHAIDLISEVLKNLKGKAILTSIGVDRPLTHFRKDSLQEKYYGFMRLKSELEAAAGCKGLYMEDVKNDASTELEIDFVLCAIAVAGFKPRCLDLHLEEPAFPLPAKSQLSSSLNLGECFSNLTSLTLNIDIELDWTVASVYWTLRESLVACTQLKEVSIRSAAPCWKRRVPYLEDLSNIGTLFANSRNIGSLELNGYFVRPSAIRKFLEGFSESVNSLKMEFMFFEEGYDWKHIFLWIGENFKQLDHFWAANLIQGSEVLETTIEISSKTDMEQKMRDLAARNVFNGSWF